MQINANESLAELPSQLNMKCEWTVQRAAHMFEDDVCALTCYVCEHDDIQDKHRVHDFQLALI